MLARAVVMMFEGVIFIAVGSFAMLWLATTVTIVRFLFRLWRDSGSADPFEWFIYFRSPEGAELARSMRSGRSLVHYSFLCVITAAIAGIGRRHRRYFPGYMTREPNASNEAMQRTAGRSAFELSMTSTFNQQRHAPWPAVADLGSR